MSVRRVAAELGIPERTLRRAASDGLLRGERVSPYRFQISLSEEGYLRTHWSLLVALRAALRTESNVRLAVLFGSAAIGTEQESSALDVILLLREPRISRVAELTGRMSRTLGREVHPTRLSDAEGSPALMVAVVEQGRVLVDRDGQWARLRRRAGAWRRLARRAEHSLAGAIDQYDLDGPSS
jgi:predicted nucleotidyltransferase